MRGHLHHFSLPILRYHPSCDRDKNSTHNNEDHGEQFSAAASSGGRCRNIPTTLIDL